MEPQYQAPTEPAVPAAPAPAREYRIAFAGDSYPSADSGGGENRGTFRLDGATSPRGIVLLTTEGRWKDRFLEGIDEVEGDRLRLCFREERRPTEFAAPPGSRTTRTAAASCPPAPTARCGCGTPRRATS